MGSHMRSKILIVGAAAQMAMMAFAAQAQTTYPARPLGTYSQPVLPVTAAGAVAPSGTASDPIYTTPTAPATGAATSAKQDTGNTSLATIATNTTGTATAANQATANSSLSTIATNTTGLATAANQTTSATTLATIATNTTVGTAGTPATQVSSVQGVTSGTPVIVGGPVANNIAASGNPVAIGGIYSTAGSLGAITAGNRAEIQLDSVGNIRASITATQSAPANTATTVGSTLSRASNGATGPLAVATYKWDGTNEIFDVMPSTTARLVSSAATTNSTLIKASACTIFTIDAINTTASVKFLKIYNKATAPTIGTDTPVLTIAIPANSVNFVRSFPGGIRLATGCGYGETGAVADNDTTAVAAGDIVALNFTYF